MDRQMFRNGGYVRQMQMGGDPMMAPPAQPENMGMPVAPPAAAMPVPQDASLETIAAGVSQQGIDPAMVESMLQQYSGMAGDLDAAAENEDYAEVMNIMRGDQATIEERRAELAGIVGQEDAAQTPDSVLTLVQPVMLMAAVDQGIGSMAPEAMNTPVTGDMAGGIMSTVNMGAEEAPMPGQGGPAPVNLNQGGAVQYFERGGGVAMPNERAQQLFNERRALYGQLIDPAQQAADFEAQKKMTQAQMLFDIAQGGLLFASGAGKPGGTPAEQLAAAFVQPLGNIGARAGELEKFRQGQKREERALDLQALGAAEAALAAEQDAAAKAALQKEANTFAASESRLNRAHQITLKSMDFDFQNADRLSQQEFTTRLQDLKFQNEVALLGLQGDQSKEAITLRNELERDNMRLGSELRIAENTLAFNQQLERDGILNTNELERMDRGHNFNLALATHKGAIAREAQAFQNAFTAAESALDRAQRENLQLSDQDFRQLMQQEMQQFTSDQAEIDRGIAYVNRAFDEDLALRGANRADAALNLQERAQTLDEAYKFGKLSLDRLAANATRLGSEAKTNTISYLTDPDRLDKYANGTLGDETTTFEQLVLDYINPKNNEVYDAARGRYVKGSATQLAPRVVAAIQKGNPTFFSTIAGQLNLDPSGGGVGTPSEPEAPKTLGQATSQIFNPDGTVNEQSNVWSLTKPNRFDKDIDYREVIGLSRIYPGLVDMASEGYAEIVGGVPSEAAQKHKKAQATLTAFANDLMQFSTNLQEDRVLKFVQELIAKETQNLRPGGFLLKTDADAVASLEALRNGFEQAMQIEAAKLTEYGGDSSGYRENQVTSARARMDQMKVLYNEILAFERGFASPAKDPGAVTRTENNQSRGNARSQILQMRKPLR